MQIIFNFKLWLVVVFFALVPGFSSGSLKIRNRDDVVCNRAVRERNNLCNLVAAPRDTPAQLDSFFVYKKLGVKLRDIHLLIV